MGGVPASRFAGMGPGGAGSGRDWATRPLIVSRTVTFAPVRTLPAMTLLPMNTRPWAVSTKSGSAFGGTATLATIGSMLVCRSAQATTPRTRSTIAPPTSRRPRLIVLIHIPISLVSPSMDTVGFPHWRNCGHNGDTGPPRTAVGYLSVSHILPSAPVDNTCAGMQSRNSSRTRPRHTGGDLAGPPGHLWLFSCSQMGRTMAV